MKSATRKGFVSLLLVCLLMTCLFTPFAGAEEEAEPEGPMIYTLPEDATLVPGKTFESYVITWEPIEDVHAYWFGAYLDTTTMWQIVGSGWIGSGYVADGEGEAHQVSNVLFESGHKAEGDATEYDLVEIVNAFCALDKSQFTEDAACNLLITIVPQSGEPITQTITLPLDLEG